VRLARGERALVPWVLGAALVVRRSAFDRVGGLDAAYVAAGDDQDLAARLARLGLASAVSPAWTVRHQPRDPVTLGAEIAANDRRFVRDHGSVADRLVWPLWSALGRAAARRT
jgi:hypothetical protein